MTGSRPRRVLLGDTFYLPEQEVLDFLQGRATLALKAMRVRGTDPTTTEFLRGADTTLTEIIDELTPPEK